MRKRQEIPIVATYQHINIIQNVHFIWQLSFVTSGRTCGRLAEWATL